MKRLTLDRATLRRLSVTQLDHAVGGGITNLSCACVTKSPCLVLPPPTLAVTTCFETR